MSANSFGLLNCLANILNGGRNDNDYAIANYLITRLDDIDAVSITDIMEHAFVTRSAVRRFCNRVGFDSFGDIKVRIDAAVYPSDLNHRDLSMSLDSYRSSLDAGIFEMFEKMGSMVGNDVIESLAATLHAHNRVILMCAGNTTGILERFQQELFYARKLVQLTTSAYRERLSDTVWGDDALLIVVSASGVFARESIPWIESIEAEKVLITANPELIDESVFGRVCCLGGCGDFDFDRFGLFGKYGIAYFFDLLSACYLHMYISPAR